MGRRVRTIAVAAPAALSLWLAAASGVARAHEPFEITADARIGTNEATLRLLIAERTAEVLCGARAPAVATGSWARCGGELFSLTGADGGRLPPLAVDARVTVERDEAVTVTYPAPGPGPLRFDATFLRRLADPTYGAMLTVTGPGVFLGQRLLRADAPSAVVLVPSPSAPRGPAAPLEGRPGTRHLGAALALSVLLAAAATLTVVARRRRHRRRRTTDG